MSSDIQTLNVKLADKIVDNNSYEDVIIEDEVKLFGFNIGYVITHGKSLT